MEDQNIGTKHGHAISGFEEREAKDGICCDCFRKPKGDGGPAPINHERSMVRDDGGDSWSFSLTYLAESKFVHVFSVPEECEVLDQFGVSLENAFVVLEATKAEACAGVDHG